MPNKWEDVLLEELAAPVRNALVGGPFGSDLVSTDYASGGVPVIRGENLSNGRWVGGEFVYISQAKAEKLSANTAGPLDIVFTQRGANHYRQVAIVPPNANQRFVISQSQMKLTVDQNRADPLFVYYVFRSPGQQEYLQRHAIQTGVPHTNLSILRKAPLRIPSLETQHTIAHILGTLDDKIEINRRMNETLEAMARAIFKSWFVDFDPVRAKAKGRNSSLPKHIADLFPDRFEDSQLGEIPVGWEVGRLGDILKLRVERCEASHETASKPYVPIDCISARSLFLAESKPGVEAQSSLTRFYKSDLLFGAMRPYFHKVCIAPFDGTTRTTAFVLFPKRPQDLGFATLLLHHPDTIEYATLHSTGSTIPYAVWMNSLEDMPAVIPPPQVREAFDDSVRRMLDRIPARYFENRTLAALRDALLPKLISGDLRVGGLKKAIPGDGHREMHCDSRREP
jgi:type I restriction enzyme, S subunit